MVSNYWTSGPRSIRRYKSPEISREYRELVVARDGSRCNLISISAIPGQTRPFPTYAQTLLAEIEILPAKADSIVLKKYISCS